MIGHALKLESVVITREMFASHIVCLATVFPFMGEFRTLFLSLVNTCAAATKTVL